MDLRNKNTTIKSSYNMYEQEYSRKFTLIKDTFQEHTTVKTPSQVVLSNHKRSRSTDFSKRFRPAHNTTKEQP